MGISVQALTSQYFRARSLGNADLANELLTEIRKTDPTFLVKPPGPVQVFTEYYNPEVQEKTQDLLPTTRYTAESGTF